MQFNPTSHTTTHLHGHILDLILSPPSDQFAVYDVKVWGFISDHALIKFSVAHPVPSTEPVNTVSH